MDVQEAQKVFFKNRRIKRFEKAKQEALKGVEEYEKEKEPA